MSPVVLFSRSNRDVIKYPEITKKIWTPITP